MKLELSSYFINCTFFSCVFLTLYPFLLFFLLHTLSTSPFIFFFTTSCSHFINDPSFSASLSQLHQRPNFSPHFSLFLALSWLSVEHLSRVANHYPQSQHLNQRFFTLFLMCPPSLTLLLTVDASPALLTQAGLSSWHEYLISLPLLTQRWLLTPFTKDNM